MNATRRPGRAAYRPVRSSGTRIGAVLGLILVAYLAAASMYAGSGRLALRREIAAHSTVIARGALIATPARGVRVTATTGGHSVTAEGDTVYTYDGRVLRRLSRDTSRVLWRADSAGGTLVGARDGVVLVAAVRKAPEAGGRPRVVLTAVDGETGGRLWSRLPDGDAIVCTMDDSRAYYATSTDRRVEAVGLRDGRHAWTSAGRVFAGHDRIAVSGGLLTLVQEGSAERGGTLGLTALDPASGAEAVVRWVPRYDLSAFMTDGRYVAVAEKQPERDGTRTRVLPAASDGELWRSNHTLVALTGGYAFGVASRRGWDGSAGRRLEVFDLVANRLQFVATLPDATRLTDEELAALAPVGELGGDMPPVLFETGPDPAPFALFSSAWTRVAAYRVSDQRLAFVRTLDGPVDRVWVQDGRLFATGAAPGGAPGRYRLVSLPLNLPAPPVTAGAAR